MSKTSVDLPGPLLEQARSVLGTTGIRDTLILSLEQVVSAHARRAHLDRLQTMRGLDLEDPDLLEDAWR